MAEKRKFKNVQTESGKAKYNELNNKVYRKCKAAKQQYVLGICEEIENHLKVGKVELAYRKVREQNEK